MMRSTRWICVAWCVVVTACGSGALKAPGKDAGTTGGARTGGALGSGGVQGLGGQASGGSGGSSTMPAGTGGQGGTSGPSTSTKPDAGMPAQGGAGGGSSTTPDASIGMDVATAIDTAVGGDGAPSGAGGAPAFDGGFGDVGGALGAFCTGSQSKLESMGQTYTGQVTSKMTDPFLDCCIVYAARFPTVDVLGVDVEAALRIGAGRDLSGLVTLGENMVSASLRASTIRGDAGRPADAPLAGTARFDGKLFSSEPWSFGLCAQVPDTSSAWAGTRLYVPGVRVAPNQWASRFRMWLLRDPTITADKAAQIGLDNIELTSQPLLDLMAMDFVELESKRCPTLKDATCTWMGLNNVSMHGSTLLSKIGSPPLQGVPFVVEADGERIHLGSFATLASSFVTQGPQVFVEDVRDDGFAIYPPINDPRVLKVLDEAGKSIP